MAGAALGAALAPAYSLGEGPGTSQSYVLASAPGGRGLVYATTAVYSRPPSSGHVYVNSGTEQNVYGTGLLSRV